MIITHVGSSGTTTIDLTSLLVPNVPAIPALPSSPVIPATSTPITPEPKAPRTARRSASKAKRQPKAVKESAKPTYDLIRQLTTEGRHDEAIKVAEGKGWDHVVRSINAHRAKHADADRAISSAASKADRRATTTTKLVDAIVDHAEKAEAAKPPVKAGRPKCDECRMFLRGDGGCTRCDKRAAAAAPKVAEIKEHTFDAGLEPKAPVKPKAAAPKPERAKRTTPKATEPPEVVFIESDFPEGKLLGTSEADLVLQWHQIAERAKHSKRSTANLIRARFEAALKGYNDQAALMASQGRGAEATIAGKRAKNVANIVKGLAAAAAA